MIANRVYANRIGNGDEQSGDGWKYRGRGFLQITGKDNYIVLSKDTRIDFLNNPDLLLNEANAMISALWFWNKKGLNDLADRDDIISITKKIHAVKNVSIFNLYIKNSPIFSEIIAIIAITAGIESVSISL